MFTGLIEEVGKIRNITPAGAGANIAVSAKLTLEGLRLGDSVAINGICLTVIDIGRNEFSLQAVGETIQNSTASKWSAGEQVNLERAMRADGRLGGHIVQGHVDGIGTVESIKIGELAIRLSISSSSEILRYIVKKGSVCIDGVSLTVADAANDGFSAAIIPHTWQNTILNSFSRGKKVNIETDVLARYVEKFMSERNSQNGLTEDALRNAGF